MSRSEIFAWLLSLGPAISASWADILALVEILKRIYARVNPAPADGTLSIVAEDELSAAEQCQVDQIREALTPEGTEALFDVSGLLQVVAWLRAHPEILAFIVSLFRKG